MQHLHRQDPIYHDLCYTSRGALAGTKNRSMGPPDRINPTINSTISEHPYHGVTSRSHYIANNKITGLNKTKLESLYRILIFLYTPHFRNLTIIL